jgi:predicted nucleic acid-binding protein
VTKSETDLPDEPLVLDASAMVDLLLGGALGAIVDARIDGAVIHAPAHLDAEVLSALGRLHRGGLVTADEVTRRLDVVANAPIERHPVADLVRGAWKRRNRVRLADALYVELATTLGIRLVTTDARLGRAARVAEVIALH